jgi:WD40 repeat protein
MKIWEVRSGRMGIAIVMPAPAGSVEFSPDGRHLLSGSGEQTPRIVQVWDAVSGTVTATVKEKENDGVPDLAEGPRDTNVLRRFCA